MSKKAKPDGAKKRKNSRAKGAAGERELSALLRKNGFALALRGQQRSGLEQADVVGVPGVHFECKRVEALNVWAAHAQARRDSPAENLPVVAMRRNRDVRWLAVLDLEAFLSLWRTSHPPTEEERIAAEIAELLG